MGHSRTRAALIYQHRTAERGRVIAAAIGQIIEADLARPRQLIGHATAGMHLDHEFARRDHGFDVGFLIGAGDGN
jgi:hypothetical protein